MKKRLSILLFILLATILLAVYQYRKQISQYEKMPAPAVKLIGSIKEKIALKNADKSVLNLALPQKEMSAEPVIDLPANPHNLKNLFAKPAAENPITIGGRLIVDEQQQPDVPVWNTVKGAEVGITIKTP